MDIKQLKYFVAIVEHNFILSRAAESLYIVQPTLSVMINEFEAREKVTLFVRKKGRIKGLTYRGERFYKDAVKLLDDYHKMHQNLHQPQKNITGIVKIGIPPLILSLMFSDIIPQLILKYPDIHFHIVELGANALRNELLNRSVDLAVLLSPERIACELVEAYSLEDSELALFVSKTHHLAKKSQIKWADLRDEKMILYDHSFMIHQLLMREFSRRNICIDLVMESSSWDFMYWAVNTNNIATILPKPMEDIIPSLNVCSINIDQPIQWRVNLCRLKKDKYKPVENFVLQEILTYFTNHK